MELAKVVIYMPAREHAENSVDNNDKDGFNVELVADNVSDSDAGDTPAKQVILRTKRTNLCILELVLETYGFCVHEYYAFQK